MTTYREAGVDIDEGDRLVELIKPLAHSTTRPEVLAGVGGFGGLFAIPPGKYKEPVLVSGTDGVGTKLKLAFMAGRHDTVGIDLVAMSVNDIAVSGAEPLFFLDYFATSRLNAEQGAQVIKGIAAGCKESGCVLIGGETAEMPGFYEPGEYDLAGFAVGVVERSKIVDGTRVKVGDAILGVASTGPHSNGYSLVRRILEKRGLALDSRPAALGGAVLADVLLAPTKLYPLPILALLQAVDVRAMAHITGGGLPGNVPRTMPDGTRAVLDAKAWKRPAVFEFLAAEGQVPEDEMYRTFNMGVGLTIVVPKGDVAAAIKLLGDRGLSAWEIGEVASGSGEATVEIR